MRYERLMEVHGTQDGIPVTLALQRRLDVPPIAFHTVSWRTQYPNSGRNRRFYWVENGGCWTLSVKLARQLLEDADSKGMLSERFDDKYERFGSGSLSFIDSNGASSAQQSELWQEITFAGREPDWGSPPRFVIGTEYGGIWRKVMLVNPAQGSVTFRSCTTDHAYPLIVRLPANSKWYMDNAMQDASTAIMRRFLAFLSQ
jgi:hypothetical protein